MILTGKQWGQPGTAAYWLTNAVYAEAASALAEDDSSRFSSLQVVEVQAGDDDIHVAVVGEVLVLLAGNDVRLNPPGVLHDAFLNVNLLMRKEAERVKYAIERFEATASDNTLSDDDEEWLTLYSGQPNRVRRALRYLSKALTVPDQYAGVLLLHR